MIRAYCPDTQNEWDKGVPLLLFAIRDSVQEALGFTSFELVLWHALRSITR